MAILGTQTVETIKSSDLEQIPSKLLRRSFGQENDSIVLSIFDTQGKLLITDQSFREYKTYSDEGGTKGTSKITSIDIDYEEVLRDYGYTNGTYVMEFSFQRKVTNNSKPFSISEISPSRKEIRVTSNGLAQNSFRTEVTALGNAILSSAFIKDINLSLGRSSALAVNIALDRNNTGLIKLYNPLPLNIRVGDTPKIYEEIINPLEVTVELSSKNKATQDIGIDIGSPNFNISTDDIFTVPSGYKTFDQILGNGVASSSFNNIQNLMSGSGVYLDLEYDNPDTPSGYHFENFIHFSSATERLKNFKYKLGLLQSYSSSIANLNNITGSTSASNFVIDNINIFKSKENKLIQGFDNYERYLYYESGAFAWPKEGTNPTRPFINAKTESAAANSWFGTLIDSNLETYSGGQMYSASKYDECNQYSLVNTIPPHIKDSAQNDKYVLFVEMIAQHFDGIWGYIDSITDLNEAHSGLKDGISKDLVLNQLTSRGISAYDQFSNSSLYEYLIGDDGTATFQYEDGDDFTMISASNAGSIPKGDIAKEIWKRLYHNSSYLLKTKGTERGLKALIACYGIPETVLHVKEYGGPLVDKTGFRTFSYQKESRMVTNAELGPSLIFIDSSVLNTTKTIQTRFLPTYGNTTEYDILSISPTAATPLDVVIGISQSLDTTNINSASFAYLVIASGSTADSSAGRVKAIASSSLGPIFNGKVWNLSVRLNKGSDEGNTIEAFATNTTPNKNTYVLSCSLEVPNFFENYGTDALYVQAASSYPIGGGDQLGTLLGPFTGSLQEYRTWTEKLTKDTIVSQSLSPFNYNGNTVSSSYEALTQRLSLGSNNKDIANGNQNDAPNPVGIASVVSGLKTVTIEETHHLPTPDTVGSGMVSDKVRIDNGTFDDNFLDPFVSVETSPQDRQPLDYSDLGVYFSPTFEVNEDIIYTLGGFRMDDYIGDPKHYTSGSYPDLKTIKDIYFQKVNNKLGIGDYVRTIQFFDHTLFKMIKEFVPAKANLKTGLVIEPHYLERAKIAGTNIDYEQKTEHLFAPDGLTGSLSSTNETIHDIIIDIPDYILSGSEGSATENVAQVGRKSRYYSLT